MNACAVAVATAALATAVATTTRFHGVDCKPHDVYPANATLCAAVPGHCLPGNVPECAFWTRGEFRPPLQPRPVSVPHPHALCDSALYDGSWGNASAHHSAPLNAAALWTPAVCELYMPSADEMLHIMQTRRIVFFGDSMARQLFLRLVAHMRGQPAVIDSHFHENAVYTVTPHGDTVAVLGTNTSAMALGPSAAAVFVWSATPDNVLSKLEPLHPDVVIFLSSYWRHDVYYDVVHPLAQLRADTFYLNTPHRAFEGAVADARGTRPSGLVTRRNYEMYRVLAGVRPNLVYVPVSDIVRASPHAQVDGSHFQCQNMRHFRSAVTAHVKQPPNGDCRDLTNLSLLRVVFTLIVRKMAA